MRKTLLIVESPAKIKTISKFLGPDVLVLSTVGHIMDLPQRTTGVTINDEGISLEYVVLEKKDKVIRDICKAAKQVDSVLLAPDPDREGELIAWHVEQAIASVMKNKDAIKRITFNEITKQAVQEAIRNQGSVDLRKVNAQQARRVLDRWVGYEVSPILWKKVRKGLSAGRVQSVALLLICNREEEIRSFKTEESWSIEALGLIHIGTEVHKLLLTVTHVPDASGKKKKVALTKQEQAERVVEQLRKATVAIASITDSKRSKKPAAPFITSTLQQAASQQLNLKVSRTMELAQKLYEGVPLEDDQVPVALITYMRTDSTRIADSALKEARSFIKQTYGDLYVPPKAHIYSGKKGQDAHEAIRPVDIAVTPELVARYLDPALHKLYTLIWKRFVACQMSEAQFAHRKVIVEGDGFVLSATGSTLLFDGFRALYESPEEEKEATTLIPEAITANMPVPLGTITPKQHFTQPPARFSEATLVKELEKAGIGRPSTYATIIKTIQARAYTELDDKKRFVPTDLGTMVVKLLVENLPKIMNVSFTAELETDLDKIASGELERDNLLRNFYTPFSHDLAEFKKKLGSQPLETTSILCPECNKANLVVRFGKAGPFVGCPRYPECTFTSNFKRNEDSMIELVTTQQPTLLDEACPKCGKPLRQMVGRFGPFVSCSGYPACKYIKETIASFPCPDCGGALSRRQWKGKIFWGCKNYPKCKFSISGDIIEKPCPRCASPYLRLRTTESGSTAICPTKDCEYSVAIAAQE